MAKLNTSMLLLLASAVGIVLSNPLLNDYSNLPQCLQPHEAGLCLAYFPRWYYDSSTDSCKEFVYGGCRGTENNFFNEQDCLEKCKGFKPETTDFKLILESDAAEEKSAEQDEVCELPAVAGECRAAFPRFFYDKETKQCEQFIYGGCDGNANNFSTIEECQQRCDRNGSSEETQDAPKVDEPKAESAAEPEAESVAENE